MQPCCPRWQACPYSPPRAPRRLELRLQANSENGLTLFAYHTALGQVVGSIAGIVAYTDTAEHTGHFVCTSTSCTTTWHPWLTDGVTVRAGAGVQQSLIGTVKRPDGTVQMTYGGHPLYLYAHVQNAVQANAQGAGGVW